jgi:hypothetical protein
MAITFKQFSTLVDLPEQEVSEEQLSEIFGAFATDPKTQEAIKKTDAIKSKLKDAVMKKAAERARAEDEKKLLTRKNPTPLTNVSPQGMKAGQSKTVDRDPFGA